MRIVRILAAVLAGALLAGSAIAQTQWHMPTPYPDSEHHTRNLREFAAEVEGITDGELRIVVHSGASLFKHPEIHRAVRGGQVPIGEMLMGLLGNDDPLFKLDNIPFLASDFEAARALWQASRAEIEQTLDADNLLLLYAVPWSPQGLYADRAIASVAEFKDMKLRAYSPLTSDLARRLGASPVNVQAAEISQAFSSGMIEAMFTSPGTGVSSQAWDFVDHYIDTRAWIPKNMVIVNKRAFRRLPENQQRAVREAATNAERRGWRMAEQETRDKTGVLAENGMQVMGASERLETELRRIGDAMTEEWLHETGERGKRILQSYEDREP